MEEIDSRTLPVDALNERRRLAVKMRLEGASLNGTGAQCKMSRTTVIAAVKASLRPILETGSRRGVGATAIRLVSKTATLASQLRYAVGDG